MDLPGFRTRFGEFESTEDGPILAVLSAAAAEVNALAWGARYDEAHGLTAAHKLALSPYGTAARMVTRTDSGGNSQTFTAYELELGRMKGGLLGLGVAVSCDPAPELP